MWLTVETKFHPESTRVRISSYFVRFGTQQVPFQDYALHSTLTGVVFVKRWICVGGTEKWTQTITRRHRIVMHSPKKKYTKPNTRTLKLTWNNTYVHKYTSQTKTSCCGSRNVASFSLMGNLWKRGCVFRWAYSVLYCIPCFRLFLEKQNICIVCGKNIHIYHTIIILHFAQIIFRMFRKVFISPEAQFQY